MALTRRFLAALGIEADKVDEIITAHTETVNGLKEEISKYKAEADKVPDMEKELNDLRKTAKDGGEYYKLKKEFEDYKAKVKGKEEHQAKQAALRDVAKDAGLTETGIAKVLKYTDYGFELDDKGKIKDAKDMIKSIREEWSEHIQKVDEHGATTPNPPTRGSGKQYKTKEEIMEIKDTAERQRAIAENHDLFGF